VRSLHLRWSSDPRDAAPRTAGSDIALVFARSAAPREGEVVLADDLLSWEQRSEIELRASALLEMARAQLGDDDTLEASEYELRVEWVNLLMAHTVGLALLRERGPFDAALPSPLTPAAVTAGVEAALGLPASTPTGATIAHRRHANRRDQVARLIIGTRAASSGTARLRVLTFPGMKLTAALAELGAETLGELGVYVAALAELGHGDAARLILQLRLPAVALPSTQAASATPPSLGALTGEEALDAALARAAAPVLARGVRRVRELVAVTARLERLPQLRAIVVPTAALGVTRLLGRWAAARGVVFASFQHGIYGLIEGDGGDRRAQVLFGWGPDVARQVALWAPPQPRLEAVGVPGLPGTYGASGAQRLRRVLVATTNNPFGTALARWSAREDFLDAISDGLASARSAGVAVELRLHPVESPHEYEEMDERAGRDGLPLAAPGSFAEVARGADLLVTPYSSVAFEAAAMAIPVALWIPSIPEAVRRRQLLPPVSDDLPGAFNDAAGFGALIAQALAGDLEAPRRLAQSLTGYVAPLDADRFAKALARLGDAS